MPNSVTISALSHYIECPNVDEKKRNIFNRKHHKKEEFIRLKRNGCKFSNLNKNAFRVLVSKSRKHVNM